MENPDYEKRGEIFKPKFVLRPNDPLRAIGQKTTWDAMGLSEADTRAKLIDPAIHRRGWTEDLIKREESAGTIDMVAPGKARRRIKGRVTIPFV